MRKESFIRIIMFIAGAFAVPVYNLIMLWIETLNIDTSKKILKQNAELNNLEKLLNIQLAEIHGEDVDEYEEDEDDC